MIKQDRRTEIPLNINSMDVGFKTVEKGSRKKYPASAPVNQKKQADAPLGD